MRPPLKPSTSILASAIIPIALSFVFITTSSYSRPNFTEEQLTKARKAASEAKYPVDFDALMDEADRLDLECEGDLTDWFWIKMCKLDVEGAQAREWIEKSKKRQEATRKETIRLINEAADIAEKKLQQMGK